jgi:hypothetical protein
MCTPYSIGEAKMKANSIGSDTPVTNDARAALAISAPTLARWPGSAARHMARAAPGRPNIRTGKNPAR